MTDIPPASAEPHMITLAEYYGWSAEGQEEILELIRRKQAMMQTVFVERLGADFDALDVGINDDEMSDVAGLLSFFEHMPDDATCEPVIRLLAIRHDHNNALQKIFGGLDWLPTDDPLRVRLEEIYKKFDAFRRAKNPV